MGDGSPMRFTKTLKWATWLAIVAPIPYGISRLLWAAGIPVGIDTASLRELSSPGWGSLGLLVLVGLSEGTALYTHAFLVKRRRTVPDRIPLIGGRPVRPLLVVAPLLAPILILAFFIEWSLGPIGDGFTIPEGNAGLPGWTFWGQVATFWLWGAALPIAVAGYWWAMRRPAG